jgi:hypothetical protein
MGLLILFEWVRKVAFTAELEIHTVFGWGNLLEGQRDRKIILKCVSGKKTVVNWIQ